MKVKHATILFLFIISIPFSFSQENHSSILGKIKGVVVDNEKKDGLEIATIKLLNQRDSLLIKGVSSSRDGTFTLHHTIGQYLMEISALGYTKQYRSVNLTKENPSIKLDTIFLSGDGILLQEIQIEAELPAMEVKGDTIVFNAGAYNIDGNSVLIDLVKQIPGLEIDQNGSLKANGKAISKILVDGKEFFGNDIGKALSTLPAEMINKLQLFEEQSEEAKASGIKDRNPEQVLNVNVKEEFKKSFFGSTKSGVGNKGRHVNRANVNRMHGDNQFSVIGNINNINDSGGNGGNIISLGSSGGGNFDNNINKEIGGNFNIQQSEKLRINGSATYRNDKSTNESANDSFSSVLNQYSERSSHSVNRRENINIGTSINWRPDSLTRISFRTRIGYNSGNNSLFSRDSMTIRNLESEHTLNRNTTSAFTTNNIDNKGFNTSNYLMINRELNKKGRNIGLTLNQSFNDSDSEGMNYSEKKYWEEAIIDTLDQKSKNDNKSVSYGISVQYVEPIGKDNRLYISYSVNTSSSKNTADIKKRDPITGEYTITDIDYSRNTEHYSLQQSINLGFQHTKGKYNLNATLGLDPSYTRNKSFPLNDDPEDLKQKVINYSPSIRLGWTPNKSTHIDFDYRGSTNHPSVTQLSNIVIIHNSMSKTHGNPDLKPSFSNNWGASFRKSNFEKGRYITANISYSYTFNNTVNYQYVDEHSNTVNTFKNIDGNSNAYLFITFNTPLKNKKINIGVVFNTGYNKNVDFLNHQEQEMKRAIERVSISPSLYGRFNSKKVESNINLRLNHILSHNNLADKQQSSNTYYSLSHHIKLKLPLDFSLESDLGFSYRTGLSQNVKKAETMWNISASKLFLKDKRGTLKFEFFDVLNDFRQQENTVNGSDYSNSWRNIVNNYFIFSFSYRFNSAAGKGNAISRRASF